MCTFDQISLHLNWLRPHTALINRHTRSHLNVYFQSNNARNPNHFLCVFTDGQLAHTQKTLTNKTKTLMKRKKGNSQTDVKTNTLIYEMTELTVYDDDVLKKM